MKTVLRVIFSSLGILLLLLALAWVGLSVAKYILYEDYLEEKQDVCTIPDLNRGFTPQGITYLAGEDAYLHSGYNGEDLALYYVRGEDVRRFVPLDGEGTPALGHGGGVTTAGGYVYIADDHALLVYSLPGLLAAGDGESLPLVMRIPVDNAASFCSAADGKLYVGEFYRAGNYETDASHAFRTPEGEEHRAIVSCYTVLEDGSLAGTPDWHLSVPGLVQGFAVHDGVIALSRSYGLSSSSLEFYDGMLDAGRTVSCPGGEVPLYYVGQANLLRQLALPAFSEDLDVQGDRVIVSFESACNKYVIGKLFFAFEAASYPFPAAGE